jgi:hypothetical protein
MPALVAPRRDAARKQPRLADGRLYNTHLFTPHALAPQVEEQLRADPRVPPRPRCEPAAVGEFWYDEYIRELLRECGPRCAHISVLPVFDLSLGRPDSHHGSFGRGRVDDAITDCRHFCNNVVDVWNVVLYNFMCFT